MILSECSTTSQIKTISTEYNGILFKSRLESRWAKFFDIFSIPYEYESEGFQEGDKMYLPDFYLPTTFLRDYYPQKGIYLEIKPEGYDSASDEYKWGVMKHKNFIVCFGNPPPYNRQDDSESSIQIYPGWDNCMKLMKCTTCGHTKFEFDEGNYRVCKNGETHNMIDLTDFYQRYKLFSDNRIFNYGSVGVFNV